MDIYLNNVIRFREKLCVIVHLCGGQPARGRELLSIRHRNIASRDIRDLFIEDGMVTFVTKYHKGFYASNDIKVIHRYLPREIGDHHFLRAVHRSVQAQDSGPDKPDDPNNKSGMGLPEWLTHASDIQAGHSSTVAGTTYGRLIHEQPRTTAYRQQIFRVVEAQQNQDYWQAKFQETSLEHQLRDMTRDEQAQFRGIQDPALEAIQHSQSPVIAVIPTGGGKSLLFILPAWICSRGTTVVVVPLLALRGDLHHHCKELKLSSIEWESRRPVNSASIVLVTPESALTEDFFTFLNRAKTLYHLDRIVIDKYHIILNNQKHFRPDLAHLEHLARFQVPMVYLTATLPPNNKDKLFRRIGTQRKDVHLFRDRTSRPNITYHIYRPVVERQYQYGNRYTQAPEIIDFIQQKVRDSLPGKVLVYANSVSAVNILTDILECDVYHGSQNTKTAILERFRTGKTSVITATSALGMGVNIPDIRCIIHIRAPHSLLEYAQESRQAGWDGLPNKAIIIQPVRAQRVQQGDNTAEFQRVRQFLNCTARDCRQYFLDRYLNRYIDSYTHQRCGDAAGGLERQYNRCEPDGEDTDRVDKKHTDRVDKKQTVHTVFAASSPSIKSINTNAWTSECRLFSSKTEPTPLYHGCKWLEDDLSNNMPDKINIDFHLDLFEDCPPDPADLHNQHKARLAHEHEAQLTQEHKEAEQLQIEADIAPSEQIQLNKQFRALPISPPRIGSLTATYSPTTPVFPLSSRNTPRGARHPSPRTPSSKRARPISQDLMVRDPPTAFRTARSVYETETSQSSSLQPVAKQLYIPQTPDLAHTPLHSSRTTPRSTSQFIEPTPTKVRYTDHSRSPVSQILIGKVIR
ncbi:unnamed protein product [Penicillium viridicatum]